MAITRRGFSSLLAAPALLRAAPRKPNIVLMLADARLSCRIGARGFCVPCRRFSARPRP